MQFPTSATAARIQLTPDYSISRVIKGGWQLSRGHTPSSKIDESTAVADMKKFAERGISTFDFGDIYVGVEEMVGRFTEANPTFPVQLHTKYVPDADALPTHSAADVERIVRRSRDRLKTDVVDLVQFHWWRYEVPGYIDALHELFRLKAGGVIRHVGVTNFDLQRMQEFVREGMKPLSIQLQYSLLDRRPENGMLEFCAAHGVHVLCYGTLAGGFLSEKYLGQPEPLPPYENRSLIKYRLIIDECGGWSVFQQLLQALKGIGDKHGVSLSTVASAYILRQSSVAAVIIGARNAEHLDENVQVSHVALDDADIATIEAIKRLMPSPIGDVYGLERYNQRHAGIMHMNNNRL